MASQHEKSFNQGVKLLDRVGQMSLLLSFKLADMVNIAVEEHTYFRSKEWYASHKDKLLVEHN